MTPQLNLIIKSNILLDF